MLNKMAKQTLSKPSWLKMSETELKKIIAELAEKHQPAEIGLILRDQYAIPTTKLYGKKLSKYLQELGLKSNTELDNAEKKVDNLKEHLKNNITDRKAKHRLQKAQSSLNKTRKYFSRKNKD